VVFGLPLFLLDLQCFIFDGIWMFMSILSIEIFFSTFFSSKNYKINLF
jgi:hypothetical protein